MKFEPHKLSYPMNSHVPEKADKPQREFPKKPGEHAVPSAPKLNPAHGSKPRPA